MKLSTRTHYIVHVILDLELHRNGDSPISFQDIAQRLEISHAYLEQMIIPLIAGGIIGSSRGHMSGVVPVKPADHVNLKEIVALLEGPTDPVECLVNTRICPRSGLCTARKFWGELKVVIDRVWFPLPCRI